MITLVIIKLILALCNVYNVVSSKQGLDCEPPKKDATAYFFTKYTQA